MSTIFELFGFPLSDGSRLAQAHRAQALCPYMEAPCDGGGNRHLSNIDLTTSPLQKKYPELSTIPSGVCSLQLKPDEAPWIVCPRRLLAMGHQTEGNHQRIVRRQLLDLLGFPTGATLGVWAEVKMKFSGAGTPAEAEHEEEALDKGEDKAFDYSFDFVIMELGEVPLADLLKAGIVPPGRAGLRVLSEGGYEVEDRDGNATVLDAPVGTPIVVEIMTSSTSGGNKKHRTTIKAACEDALLGRNHVGPGINKRQVWARMVSQLIVKSEVAIRWGGRTIWVLQDNLVDYINQGTGLDLNEFKSVALGEVNVLTYSYNEKFMKAAGPLELEYSALYAGPISTKPYDPRDKPVRAGFLDIIRTPSTPPLAALLRYLMMEAPKARVEV